MKSLKKNLPLIIVILLIIVLSILKQLLISNFPVAAYLGAGEDDVLMIKNAKSILEGNWLGTYKYNTLMKGPGFPLYLALLNKLHFSFINSTTFIYTVACILFIVSIRKYINNKIAFVCIFALILFNPIMYTLDVLLRVYRNGIVPGISVLIMASYIGMFNHSNEKRLLMIPWSLLASICFSFFYYTREDSIWIVPFIVFMMICSLVLIIRNIIKSEDSKKRKIIITVFEIFMLILPIITSKMVGEIISNKNKEVYGYKMVNVQNEGEIANTMRIIFSIESEVDYPYVITTRNKMDRMMDASPTLMTIKDQFNIMCDNFSKIDRNQQDNEVENGWWIWAFRSAVYKSGYDTLEKEQEFYKNVNKELNAAIEEEKFNTVNVLTTAVYPWKNSFFKELPKTMIESTIFVARFTNTDFKELYKSDANNEKAYKEIKDFEYISNDRALVDENSEYKEIEELNGQEQYISKIEPKVKVINVLIKIYKVISPIIFALGVISYIVYTILLIKNVIKKEYKDVAGWVIASSLLGTLFTIIVGVSYTHISACYAITTLYLCGAYFPLLAFSIITTYLLVSKVLSEYKKN